VTLREQITAWRRAGQNLSGQIASALARRSPREQWLLAGLGVMTVVAISVLLVWRPLLAARSEVAADLARYRTLLAGLEARGDQLAAQVQIATFGPSPTDSAAAAGLVISRIEPSDDRTRIVIEDADFDTLLFWLRDLEAQGEVSLAAVSIDRLPEPGRVNADLLLGGPP
jgi:general secretion pathway protein M